MMSWCFGLNELRQTWEATWHNLGSTTWHDHIVNDLHKHLYSNFGHANLYRSIIQAIPIVEPAAGYKPIAMSSIAIL
jgi:hypothetical protein